MFSVTKGHMVTRHPSLLSCERIYDLNLFLFFFLLLLLCFFLEGCVRNILVNNIHIRII